jgi:hypothetical protein
MTVPKRNIFAEVERIIKCSYEYEKKLELLNILLNNEVCGIKILGLDSYHREYKARLPEKEKSLPRITYILIKWYNQQLKGNGGIVKYFLWEEQNVYSTHNEIFSAKA